MLKDLSTKQYALATYMSYLSELAYSAAWMEGLEYELWHAIESGPQSYGRLRITSEHINELSRLYNTCEGWIYFDDLLEETFIGKEAWTEKYLLSINS